jgi:NAD-dependent dihydropyrimidine dehydrogenase PreA subunit
MSMRITDECISCGACEPECPHGAISGGDPVYAIDASRCTGCPGQEPLPCAAVCPVECIAPTASPREPNPQPELRPEPDRPPIPTVVATSESPPPGPFLVPRILWGALVASTLIYLVIGTVAASAVPFVPMLLPVFAVVAVPLALASLLLPARLLRSALRRLELPVEAVLDPTAERSYREAAPSRRRFTDAPSARRRAVPALHTSMVIGLASAEVVSILGLVLRLQGASWPQVAGFFVVCWALMIAHFPSPARLNRALERTYRAGLE